MDFIYRIPLVSFDPDDPGQVIRHWEEVKEKIKSSSPSLHSRIANKDFRELDDDTARKVRKYLIRGRYRSTPFGKWAVVGLGSWAGHTEAELELVTEPIPKPGESDGNEACFLAKNIQVGAAHLRFWFFDPGEKKWAYGIVERNKLVDLVIRHFDRKSTLAFPRFSSWFKDFDPATVRGLWEKTLETGLLYSKTMFKGGDGNDTNLRAIHPIHLDSNLRDMLDGFLAGAGDLFQTVHRPVLRKFARLFQQRYDDRFVSLGRLVHDEDILGGSFSPDAGDEYPPSSRSSRPGLFPGLEGLDFQARNLRQPLPDTVFDIQILFHLGKGGNIHVDNIVCNRPFAFTGRFTDDPEIFRLAKSHAAVGGDFDPIYCDVVVIESGSIGFLTRHRNCFRHHLSPIDSQHEGEIPLSELYLGVIREEVILVWEEKRRRVIPVFQHPLNGNQISHPLFRLLWEIANQHTVKFLPYVHSAGSESSYSSKLCWGALTLQPRKWVLHSARFPTGSQLKAFLQSEYVPGMVLAGNEDRELLLKWENPSDFALLWQELDSRGKVTVLDAQSFLESPFRTSGGNRVYPQFVYQKSFPRTVSPLPETVNYLEEEDESCLYFRVVAAPNILLVLIKETLPILHSKMGKSVRKSPWYYVTYGLQESELRIRFPRLGTKDFRIVSHLVFTLFHRLVRPGYYYQVPHHPEFRKYGREGMPVSESLFHVESTLMVAGHHTLSKPLACSSGRFRLRVISEIWSRVFLESGNPRLYLDHLKAATRAIPLGELRLMRAEFDGETGPLSLPEICTTYLETLKRHPCFPFPNRQKTLLLNHFHMMANRFFPLDAGELEDISNYLTYRKLGRSMHAGLA